MQDVEQVRRDIRIVNLSLLNTNWYIHQLKNEEPYGAKRVPISISDGRIENIQPVPFEARSAALPVPRAVLIKYSVNDTSITNKEAISFTIQPTIALGNYRLLRVQDLMVLDIVRSANWERPVYFAMTVSDDSKVGLREFMQLEGLAFRLVPRKGPYWENLNEGLMRGHFFTDPEKPSKEPQRGFLWRGLRDSTVYYDEDVRRLMINYRQAFLSLGYYYANVKKEPSRFAEVLDRMEEVIPRRVIRMPAGMKFDLANYYGLAGRQDRSQEFLREVVDELAPIVGKRQAPQVSEDNAYILLLRAYEGLGMYKEAEDLLAVIREVYASEQGVEDFVKEQGARLRTLRGSKDTLAFQPSQPAKGK